MSSEWVVQEYPPRSGHEIQTGKIASGIKVTHYPSGISETCTEYRSQHKNRDFCIRRIRQRLEEEK